jgi:starvation-inducible DNA-binding protein
MHAFAGDLADCSTDSHHLAAGHDRRSPVWRCLDDRPEQGASAERGVVADGLARLLADTYTLYLKTQGYHWNVTGPQFRALHLMFEEQYLELRDAVDEIAERIRALGPLAPGSYREMERLTSVSDEEGAPEAMDMVHRLIEANETVVSTAREAVRAAEEGGDPASLDLATRRITVHEKTLWMLRATAADVPRS